jgi:hypothetical protein
VNLERKLLNLAEIKSEVERKLLLKIIFDSMNIPTTTSPERILRGKQRRRQAEYIGLAAFQFSFAFIFRQFLAIESGIAVFVSAFSLGLLLAFLREKRRTLSSGNRSRILTEAVESLMIMMLIALSIIVCLKLGIQLLVVQVHLCVFLASYFCGSLIGETRWVVRNFEYLSPIERNNYLVNLNGSIIFPYNIEFLRSLFRK